MRVTSLVTLCSLLLLLTACGEPEKPATPKITDIDSLIKLYPDSVEILVAHGNVMLERYDYNKALADGAKAYRMAPNNTDARFLYANALNNRAERTVTDVMTAQTHFGYVLQQQPRNLEALVAIASTYSQQGDYEKSFQYINRALRINKRYRDAYVLKGTNYLQLGKKDLAISSYQTAIQQDPDFFEAYLFLGNLYLRDKNELALEYYKSAVQLKPKSVEALYSLAYGYQNFDRPEDALRIYRQMAKLESSYTPTYFQEGYIKQFQQNDIDSAIFFYQLTLQKEPRYVEAWHNLGLCYVSKNDRIRALEAFSKALKYDPEFTKSREEAEKLRY